MSVSKTIATRKTAMRDNEDDVGNREAAVEESGRPGRGRVGAAVGPSPSLLDRTRIATSAFADVEREMKAAVPCCTSWVLVRVEHFAPTYVGWGRKRIRCLGCGSVVKLVGLDFHLAVACHVRRVEANHVDVVVPSVGFRHLAMLTLGGRHFVVACGATLVDGAPRVFYDVAAIGVVVAIASDDDVYECTLKLLDVVDDERPRVLARILAVGDLLACRTPTFVVVDVAVPCRLRIVVDLFEHRPVRVDRSV